MKRSADHKPLYYHGHACDCFGRRQMKVNERFFYSKSCYRDHVALEESGASPNRSFGQHIRIFCSLDYFLTILQ